ncbi:UDP-glucose 4-epimerase GalE [Pandoraea sp.]|uniref:UDP-glucose 4-epimerase GalE n=1 Tax=Pandoraea sp. TaxID=1883445 RepID=UPI00120E5BB9|nr:UDP-glucose 4-epimerase GalE [Pandoraea sp.]TAL55380.1 MAG: UDP-glucose 4-epimerase GalE [Pandoraea sp.]TAM15708.1 MAG: UDP-glucose 4-epimerase GalE [Pandoraea sp.]
MLRILVVGGAGYIGSHMVKMLGRFGCNVTTLDNLSSGYRDAVLFGEFVQGDMGDEALLNQILTRGFDAVMHFASCIQVGESMRNPEKYYQNNVVNTLNLLNAMRDKGVMRLIFSSTAATFGEPQYTPIDERHPQQPINPYGRTKLMVEQALADYDNAYGLRYVALRYFNAAGADSEGQLGERHDPETHLVPLVLQAASGRRPHVSIYGRDYDTPDGTCIRDYVHVEDLCFAHWLALQSLMDGATSQVYNLGHGSGFSVREVIDTAMRVTGREIVVLNESRRAGDPARLVANPALANASLGWRPQYSDLVTIIKHAWSWENKRV